MTRARWISRGIELRAGLICLVSLLAAAMLVGAAEAQYKGPVHSA
jgi:hypothetical protein